MKRREKILIIGSALAIIFFVVFKFTGTDKEQLPGKTEEASLASTDQFVTQQLEMMQNIKQLDADEMIIKKAFINWDNDTFASSDLLKLIEGKTQIDKTALLSGKRDNKPVLYSGYLKVGKKLLAIINGREYEKGDTVEGTYYKVVSISSEAIMVRMPDSVFKTIPIVNELGPLARNEIGI